ncbi:MAG: SDR family NAD(P)-dependent oxidoreductase, partial [Planctomycetia bacterium]|nr:SDR family NAD(P)-dependent oxidoreductase [Planctomycetia bacterium]
MNGQTCLVTGATSGIGEVTSQELARRGAKVLLVGRNRE